MSQEIHTGLFFPSALAQNPKLKLAGVGVRRKVVFHVYAFGLYIHQKSARAALKENWAHQSVDKLVNDQNFFEAFLNDNFDKALVLTMYRKISGDLLNEAFNSSLLERIKKIGLTEAGVQAENQQTNKEKAKDEVEPLVALEAFKKLFSDRNLGKLTKLTFQWQKKGVLIVHIDSEQVGKIVSPILCHALFDIYLGINSIDPKAKFQVAAHTYKLLNAPPKEDKDMIDKNEEAAVEQADKKSRLPRKLAALKSKL